MELRHLKYFLAVAEELNFTKASEKLFISQPPLSRQIIELEEELQAKLFIRNNKKVELTEAGKYFEKEAKALFQNLERVSLKTKKIAENVSGEFRIAYISSIYSAVISDLIKHLKIQFPYVNFKLFEVSTTKQIDALEQGKIEMGIIRSPIKSPKIKSHLWFQDGFSIVFNKNDIQLKSEKEILNLKEETFVFFNKDYAPHYHEVLLELCAFYGFTPKIIHEANNINSIVQLVKNGLGISIVPINIAKNNQDPEIGFIELKKVNLRTDVSIITSKEDDSEIIKTAVDFLLKKSGSR
ncbi:DNA-binding transcriptional regulator, LysR family [Flavobacterium sp. CF108]|uniref:LysR family transcriptional regulator n=1 Tax=unclassified Flavobacterium TaxID=196869 RepID=UPI0008D3661F|nr:MULTISPECIES: LysR substrate-binding domain-containing protein [unclassified Flavobacterium]SEN97800.1 DNA-binding transcriptional regulator, LysR family [Flavobacterium sp. fv08]SHH32475.1 DNA-binding transcriptional regulator, LysR family [Flavobacterium sp. CF108]